MKSNIGQILEQWGGDGIEYITRHQIAFWVVGMLLTVLGIVFLGSRNFDEFCSFKMIVLLIFTIPSVGWFSIFGFMLPCLLLSIIGYCISNPIQVLLNTLKYGAIILFVGCAMWVLSVLMYDSNRNHNYSEADNSDIEHYEPQ